MHQESVLLICIIYAFIVHNSILYIVHSTERIVLTIWILNLIEKIPN